MTDMDTPIGLLEPEVTTLEKMASDLELDLDGVRTLISEINRKGRDDVDTKYTWGVINTVKSSLARHLVKLDEVGHSLEEPLVTKL